MFVARIRLWIPLLAFMLPSLAVCGSRSVEVFTGQPGRELRRVQLATVIEGESLVNSAKTSAGPLSVQAMQGFGPGWSGGAQLFWRAPDPVDRPIRNWPHLAFGVRVDTTGQYRLTVCHTQAPDYGDLRVFVRTTAIGDLDGYAPQVRRVCRALEPTTLMKGGNPLTMTVIRKASAATGSFVGLDSLEYSPVESASGSEPKTAVAPGAVIAPRAVLRAQPSAAAAQPSADIAQPSAGIAQPSAGIAQPSAAIAQPGGNVLVAGPKLTFAAINSQKLKWNVPGETQADIYRDSDQIVTRYVFQSPYAANFTWRWQVSTKPFPAQASVSAPGIVGQGLVSGTAFAIDLTGFPPLGKSKVKGLKSTRSIGAQSKRGATFSNTSRPASGLYYVPLQVDAPVDLFVRIIAIKDNKPVGPPSNSVVAHFKLGSSPTQRAMQKSFEWAARVKELQAKAKMFQIALTSFTPAAFPTQVGCVVIIDNPHYGKPVNVFAGYQKGVTYCPPKDPKYEEKSDWDWFVEGLKGYAFAWDKLVELYDDAKAWVVNEFVSLVPCEALGEDAGAVCESALEKLGNAALTVALAAVGVPPTLPDIATLTELGKGKIVEAAVDFTCNRLAESGAPCDDFMRQKLKQLYTSGVNELQSGISVEQATEPECGQSQMLKDAGKLPLPCFGKQGIKVKAAPGAFYRPPLVTLKVTRIKPPLGVPSDCVITTSLALENHFKGGYVGGAMTAAKDIQGEPFYPVSSPVPTLKMGESKALTLAMTTPQGFSISANSWSKTGVYTEWLALYLQGTGQLTTASSTTSLKVDETPIKTQCSETVNSPITIP